MERLSTGVKGLDEMTQGGLPRGRCYLLCGEPGTGKTTLSLQFLMEGLRQGDKCLYITIDEKPEQIIENAKNLGWDLQKEIASGLLSFMDITAYFGEWKRTSEHTNFNRIINNVTSYIEDKKITRLAIDPISPLIFAYQRSTSILYFIRKMVFSMEALSFLTTLLVSPVPVGESGLSRHGVEEVVASGIIHLRLEKTTRILSIRKLRGTACDLSEYRFDIAEKDGILIKEALI